MLHVRDGYDVFSYRRDSSYAADLYFEDSYWYGKEIVKEYKTTNGYFFHTIVASDGWIASMGGPDITSVVNQLEALAGATWDGGRITWDTLNMAYGLVSSMGMGHFLIKAPNNQVGYVIVNSGSRMDLFTMSDGQYIEVPNGPGYFRSGFASTADPVEYAIYRAMTNPWGVNHRNIITYQVIRDSDIYNYLTYVNIYASRTISSDKIVIGGHVIHGSYLPAATGYMLIGQSVLKIPIPTTTFGYQNMIYTYSKILNAYKNTGSLPGSVVVGPWMVNVKHVADAAVHVKNYIDTNHQLPSVATVNGIVVTLPTFLSLLTASVLQINISDFNTLMNPQNFGNPSQPREQMTNGEMQRSEYIAIAQNVKNFMNNQLKAPEFAYNTSLGLYFGYQNMIYTYSKIMAIYNSTGTLPSSIKVSSWRFLCDPNAATFSVNNVLNAATWTKEYIETNYQLPLVVTVNDGMDIMGNTVSRDIDMSSFLGLLINSLIQLNSGQTTVDYMTFGTAPNPRDSVHLGNMPKNEYISIARNVKNFMDVQGKAPEYAYSTSLGLYFGYQNMIYTYSKILDTYKTDGYLPAIVQIKSWSTLIDPNIARLRPLQIVNAATEVKNFVESNFQLPSMVNISGQSITMPTFLGLLTGCVLQINSNDLVSEIDSIIYGYAPVPRDSMSAGNLPKSEYLGIALNVKNFMDVQGKAPEYAYSTSLGLYFGYENMIYTFSKVLDAYNCSGFLPGSVSVKPWRVLSDSNIATFSLLEIVSAAVVVKNYVDVNFQLPLHVTINGHNIIMPTFLELLTTAVLQLNKTDLVTPINSKTYGPAPVPRDSMSAGNLPKSEYLGIARNVKNFMDVQGKAPEYAYSTSLGLYFGYENMIYTFSKVLDAYNTTKTLNTVSLTAWKIISNPSIGTFTSLEIVNAATEVKYYIENNHQLPANVNIKGKTVFMADFLEYLTTVVLQINNNDFISGVDSVSFSTAPYPRDSMNTGNMLKSEYLGIARNVKNFMDVQGKAPEYAYSTSLGLYFGYENMIYTFSKYWMLIIPQDLYLRVYKLRHGI
ncbi:MAG: hypothetical protein HVN35_07420 [Methanobacteriaceae archaeon]|nr:hypothetical protein [Methanobacteriaceae archaeon]